MTTGTVLWQCNVETKEHEIRALKPWLPPTLVKGRIFSLDAMPTQRLMCGRMPWLQGDYVLFAKENQPSLREDIADLFEDPSPARRRWQQAETCNKGHGRLEHRQLTASPDLNDWLGKAWEGIEQVFRLERTIRTLKSGNVHHEVVYGLSSLSLQQAPPARMLPVVRNHWAIENRLHCRRDVTLKEDVCQTRTGAAPSLGARLKSTVLSLMDRLGVSNVARQGRYLDAHVEQALQLVLTAYCSVF